MDLKTQILDAVAANLREFGYPDARGDNITTTRIFAMFAERQIKEFGEKHAGDPNVQSAVESILVDIDATIGTEG